MYWFSNNFIVHTCEISKKKKKKKKKKIKCVSEQKILTIEDLHQNILKVHQCRFGNLPVCSCSYKNTTLKISRS